MVHLSQPHQLIAISSPNYPENYPDNARVFVTILVPSGASVELHILDLDLGPSCLFIDFNGKAYYAILNAIKWLNLNLCLYLHTYP